MEETIFSTLHPQQIAKAMNAHWNGCGDAPFLRPVTDSRIARSGDLFFALKGEKFDAHDFLPQVIQNGCKAVVISRPLPLPSDVAVFTVDCVETSFADLARALLLERRKRAPFQLIAVTGSNGKTTTKEILASIAVELGFHPLKTQGNHNNDIGLPMTVMDLSYKHDLAILEMGANHPGDIRRLCTIAPPDLAIITSIGAAHLEGFLSIDGVARAKSEILESSSVQYAVLPQNIRNLIEKYRPHTQIRAVGTDSDFDVENLSADASGIHFTYKSRKFGHSYDLSFPKLGLHNAMNIALAITLFESPDAPLDASRLQRALTRVTLPSGRLEKWKTPLGTTFIHDAYNANPLSMGEALKLMQHLATPKQRILILGEMRELGNASHAFHDKLGKDAAQAQFKKLLCVGESADIVKNAALKAGAHPDDVYSVSKEELLSGLEWLAPSLDANDICLIKGSRGIELERCLPFFQASKEM